MEREDFPPSTCSVARALEVIGDRWTLLVLREAFWGVRRFDRMQRNLGIARNILADRLQKLVAAGLLTRRRYQERPERFEYRLTQKGADLWPALVSLLEWGDRHLSDADSMPTVLVHGGCGHETVPRMACSHCGEPVDAHSVRGELRADRHRAA